MRIPRVIANTVSVRTDLVWINQRTMQFVTEPQNLVSDKDDRRATHRARISCRTLGDRYIQFWLIVCRERRDAAVFDGQLKKLPVGAGTYRVGMVVNLVPPNVFWNRLGDFRPFVASATRTRYHGLHSSLCATGTFGSVVIESTTAKTATVL